MRRERQSGAALLIALLIMTLVATLAAGMVWLQWRGIEVETAERARTQGEWLLNASLDWGNLILRSSIRTNSYKDDDLGQPWATPLAETKLSSFLSADGSHNADGGPEAYLSGQITDATSKYNLYNLLVDQNKTNNVTPTSEIVRLQILFRAIGVSPDVATTIADGLRDSWGSQQHPAAPPGGQATPTNSVLMPVQVDDLVWLGVDPKVVKQIEPFVQLIPLVSQGTLATVNANTAPAEVLMAACPVLTRAQAEQIILQRRQQPFQTVAAVTSNLGLGPSGCAIATGQQPDAIFDVKSQFFEIFGQLRYEQHVIRERSVIMRGGPYDPIKVLRRERLPPDAA